MKNDRKEDGVKELGKKERTFQKEDTKPKM